MVEDSPFLAVSISTAAKTRRSVAWILRLLSLTATCAKPALSQQQPHTRMRDVQLPRCYNRSGNHEGKELVLWVNITVKPQLLHVVG